MKRLAIIIVLLSLITAAQCQEYPRGEIVDCYKKDHPTMIVEKMEFTDVYSIMVGLVWITASSVFKAHDYAINNDKENWQAIWDTIDDAKQKMYQQIKDPSNFHFGIKKDGFKLFVIDYYTRERDTVYMIPTGGGDNPYREASSYLKEWKDAALLLDNQWSFQNRLINEP